MSDIGYKTVQKCEMGNQGSECVDNLTICPIADDVDWYKRRPHGAGPAVYKWIIENNSPDGWMVLCMDCYKKRRDRLKKGSLK